MKEILYLSLAGIISGVVGGMGMGGGTLLIPILTIFLSFSQKVAQGINLVVFIPMSIVALIIHIKNKLVDFRVGIPIIIVGIVFSIVGSLFANNMSNSSLRTYFGIFLLFVGVFQFIQTFINSKTNKEVKQQKQFKFRIYYK